MPSFKPKSSKIIKVSQKNITTLDSKHKEFLNEFEIYDNVELPKLLNNKKEIINKLNNNLKIEEKLELQDNLKDIKKQIKYLKLKKKNYYLNNSKYIFDYFENKKNIAEGKNNTKILNTFFNVKDNKIEKNQSSSFKKYLANVEDKFINIDNYIYKNDICNKCKNGELITIQNEGISVCNKCSYTIRYIVENEKQSYKDPPKEVTFYAYKRINHFREILAQFQAKETTLIPNQVLEDVKFQIKKERITIEQLTNKKAKEILKKLGYNKYYEHIPFIKDKLGIKPPIMTPELEERLCNLFIDIQGPYSKFCPEDRVNFLNYYYTVYKLCELLEQRQFLPYFPMLKDREKRIEQDEIWKKICEELNWTFIPTI
jgi:ribosomal protein L37AE/L43A